MDIFLNKIQNIPVWKLDLTIQPGIMVNYETWVLASECNNKLGQDFTPPWDEMFVEVSYDGVVLFEKQSLSQNKITISHELPDDTKNPDHILKIVLSGKTDNHSFIYADKTAVTAMIKVQIDIEDLPINLCLENNHVFTSAANGTTSQWSEFIGENGKQIIEINTPIYQWLFQHEQKIIQEMALLGQLTYG